MTDTYSAVAGGPAATDWHRYGLDELWHAVNDGVDHRNWDQIRSWRVMAELCRQHAETLADAANTLTQRWDPERSASARVFIDRVADLVVHMQTSACAAIANASAAEQVLNAQLAAFRDLSSLVRERERARATAGLTTWYLIRAFDRRAQDLMAAADLAVADARSSMSVPAVIDDRRREPPPPGPIEAGPGTGSNFESWPASVANPDPLINRLLTMKMTPIRTAAEQVIPSPRDTGSAVGTILNGGIVSDVGQAPAIPTSITTSEVAHALVSGTEARGQGAGGVIGLPLGVATGSSGSSTPGGAPHGIRAASTPIMAPPMTSTPIRPSAAAGGVGQGGVMGNSYAARRRKDPPDGPWSVSQGTPAVIRALEDPEDFDPGPGIIGINR